ncbi:MAG: sigma-54-dependent Fis family transcriptional regulator [Planctomycetales bacterium]|nr:sigma-54-dependent Fis family transcriptional regulator [Planctomycetales bacterium]
MTFASPTASSAPSVGDSIVLPPSPSTVRGRILVADDDPVTRRSLELLLTEVGYQVTSAADGQQAQSLVDDTISLALFDLQMPLANGMDCLRYVRQRFPDIQVMMISGEGEIHDAVAAMKEGAFEFIAKPFDKDKLLVNVDRAITATKLSRDNRNLRDMVGDSLPVTGFSPKLPQTKKLLDQVGKVVGLDSTILLTGESGTGKTTIARYIHQQGPRADQPFVSVNCASLPRDLIEAELFGHARGAFTGAVKDRPGRAEIADGGTLFLDEIGDLPLELQPKLLTFLQDRTLQRIGCNEMRRVDVRVIAASHQDLASMCRENRFRQDLYYRLNVLSLRVPSLRERTLDIPELAQHVLRRIQNQRGGSPLSLSDAARNALLAYNWPGNIRELENVLERASAFCDQGVIQPTDLALHTSQQAFNSVVQGEFAPSLAGMTLAEVERKALIDTLKACSGNKAKAAREMDISEKSIYNKMKRYNITMDQI